MSSPEFALVPETHAIVNDLSAILNAAMQKTDYFIDESVPSEFQIPWPGLNFTSIGERDVLGEKQFVILTSPTTGLPLCLVQTNPDVYKVDVKGDEGRQSKAGVDFVVYEILQRVKPPTLVLCHAKTGERMIVQRDIITVSLTELGGQIEAMYRDMVGIKGEPFTVNLGANFWALRVTDALKNKAVVPISSIDDRPATEEILSESLESVQSDLMNHLYADFIVGGS